MLYDVETYGEVITRHMLNREIERKKERERKRRSEKGRRTQNGGSERESKRKALKRTQAALATSAMTTFICESKHAERLTYLEHCRNNKMPLSNRTTERLIKLPHS